MKSIKKLLGERKEIKEKTKAEQKKCKHKWIKIPTTIRVQSSTSLLTIFFGELKEMELETDFYFCEKCDKEIYVEIE